MSIDFEKLNLVTTDILGNVMRHFCDMTSNMPFVKKIPSQPQ